MDEQERAARAALKKAEDDAYWTKPTMPRRKRKKQKRHAAERKDAKD